MNNLEKLIKNGGWQTIDDGAKTGEPVLLKNQALIDSGDLGVDDVVCDVWYQDRVQGGFDTWDEFFDFPPTHYMPLGTPERMAKVIGQMRMRLAQIASGDYKTCGHTAEEVAASALLEAEEIAGGGDA